MKKSRRYSLKAFAVAMLLIPALAGCSNDQSRFSQMSKDEQIRSIQYQADHPTPQQAAIVAKMKAAMAASRASYANGAKAGPPALPSGSTAQ